eukprot:TRINITY_DN5130_c0_g1_i10.p2 TRINITY_DN5130_c0_g1~~TRINITY_DN5130_c0_g1_i10.p2  ORF type:complete len:232 (-),score=18.00 TRINITY_DN5130_c0_g1_i10:459-1154(-)
MISNSNLYVLSNGAGEVNDQLLRDMYGQLQRQSILGWFVYRGGKMQASARENATCYNMVRSLIKIQTQSNNWPLIFGIMQKTRENGGATISLQHRFFQAAPRISLSTPFLKPVRCQILGSTPAIQISNNEQGISSDHKPQIALSQGSMDAYTIKLPGSGIATSLQPNMKQVKGLSKIISDASDLQVQTLNKMYKNLQNQLRNEVSSLVKEMAELQENKEKVDQLRNKVYNG